VDCSASVVEVTGARPVLVVLIKELLHHGDLGCDVAGYLSTLRFVLSVAQPRAKSVKPFDSLLKADS
jgi:hypothetical protein